MMTKQEQMQAKYLARVYGFAPGDSVMIAGTRTDPPTRAIAVEFDAPHVVVKDGAKAYRVLASRCRKFDENIDSHHEFSFATDSETGTIYAKDWDEARTKLEAMVPEYAVEAGGWGWVQSLDGSYRHVVGLSNWKGAQ